MAVFKLTSLERMKIFLGLNQSNVKKDGEILQLIPSISNRVQDYLRRMLKNDTYVQFLNPAPDQKNFDLHAYPIDSITSLEYDSEGEYTGNESTVDTSEYKISSNKKRVVTEQSYVSSPKSMKATYTGGLAASGVNSTLSVSGASIFTADKYIKGSLSSALGRVVSSTTPSWQDNGNVVASLRFNEDTGTTASDDKGNYDGTVTNGTIADGDTDNGKCIDFNGTDTAVNLGNITQLNCISAFSVSFDVYFDTINGDEDFFEAYDDASNSFAAYVSGSTNLVFSINSGGDQLFIGAGISPVAETWYNYTIVFNGAGGAGEKVAVYVDGVATTISVVLEAATTMPTLTGDFILSSTNLGGGSVLDGKIDNLVIWKSALTATQAAAHAAQADTTSIIAENLVGSYETSDVLTQYSARDDYGNASGSATSGITGTISSIAGSIAQLYPDITYAVEWIIRLKIDHKFDIEKLFIQNDEIAYKTDKQKAQASQFINDIRNMLEQYRNKYPWAKYYKEEVSSAS